MPIQIFSSMVASQNLRSDRTCQWPDGRKSNTRLEGIIDVSIIPTFKFSIEDKVFTIGSCFAREIEKYLSKYQFNLPGLNIKIPANERVSQTENDILNKYTVHSIENELRWAFEGNDLPFDAFYLKAEPELYHDPHLAPNLKPASFDRVKERRALITGLFKDLPSCRIIVITLGLGEAWFDTKNNIYLNGIPTKYALANEPNRFELHVMAYEDIYNSLERIYSLLKLYGHPDFKMLITVSPVPFKATFSGKDAVIANTYSKCVQRSAVEKFVSMHENVNYFPSYEIVTLSNREKAYEIDNIHVTKAAVGKIMMKVVNSYVDGLNINDEIPDKIADSRLKIELPSSNNLFSTGKNAMANKDYGSAITIYTSLLFRFSNELSSDMLFDAQLNLGVALLRTKLTTEGVRHLQEAKRINPDHPRAIYKLGLGLARCKLDNEALQEFIRAHEINPIEPDYCWRLGVQYIRVGENDLGLNYVRKALLLDPMHQNSLEVINKYK